MSNEIKLELGEIIDVLRQRVDPETLKIVTADLLATQRALAAEKEAEKGSSSGIKSKNRFVILVRGDASLKPLVAGGAFVLSVPDSDTPEANTYMGDALLQRFYKAVSTYNDIPEKRGRGRAKTKMKTFFDAIRRLKPKVIKESGSSFKIKNVDPVEVIVVEKEEV